MHSTHTGAGKGKKKSANIIHIETIEQIYLIFKNIKIIVTLLYALFMYLYSIYKQHLNSL